MITESTYWQKSQEITGPSRAAEFSSIGQQETREALERFIIAESSHSSRVLDAGCNTGVEGYRLFERGFCGEYLGIDSNSKALTFALQNLSGKRAAFLLSDLSEVPLPSRAAEIVFTKDVIEHAEHYGSILRELSRLSGRYLVVSFFIRPSSKSDIIQLHPEGYYLNRYALSGINRLMDEEGFSAGESIFASGEDEIIVFTRTTL